MGEGRNLGANRTFSLSIKPPCSKDTISQSQARTADKIAIQMAVGGTISRILGDMSGITGALLPLSSLLIFKLRKKIVDRSSTLKGRSNSVHKSIAQDSIFAAKAAKKQLPLMSLYFIFSAFVIVAVSIASSHGNFILERGNEFGGFLFSIFESVPLFKRCEIYLSLVSKFDPSVVMAINNVNMASSIVAATSGLFIILSYRYYTYLQYIYAIHDECVLNKPSSLDKYFGSVIGFAAFGTAISYVIFSDSYSMNYCIALSLNSHTTWGLVKLGLANFSAFFVVSFSVSYVFVFLIFYARYCRGGKIHIEENIRESIEIFGRNKSKL